MTLRPSSQGHRRASVGRKQNRKAPSVAGGAQKILARGIQRTRNSLVHPLKVDTKIRETHIIAVRLKPRMTILLNAGCFRIDQQRIEHKQTEQLLSVCHFTIAGVLRQKSFPARGPRRLNRVGGGSPDGWRCIANPCSEPYFFNAHADRQRPGGPTMEET
jgi:hypothetical protein